MKFANNKRVLGNGFMEDFYYKSYEVYTNGKKLRVADRFAATDMMKLLSVLARAKPVELISNIYSADATLDNCKDKDARFAFKLISEIPRSVWMKGSQSDPDFYRYSVATPLGLYAMKEHYKIRYSAWDITDDKLWRFMSYGFCTKNKDTGHVDLGLIKARKEQWELPEIEEEDLPEVWSMYCARSNPNMLPKSLPSEEFGPWANSNFALRSMAIKCAAFKPERIIPGASIVDPCNWDATDEYKIEKLPIKPLLGITTEDDL